MELGVCKASHDTIAERAGMSRRSVIDLIKILIKAGYIEDLTPEVRNEPHKLCTKKGMQNLHTKEHNIKEEEPERYAEFAHQNGEGMQDLPTRYAKSAQLGMQNLHKNRYIEEIDSIDDSESEDEPTPTIKKAKEPIAKKVEAKAMFKALAEVCQYDLGLISTKERGQLNQAEKKMRENGYTPDDLKGFEKWWYAEDWRGKQRQAPSLNQIRENWGRYKNHLNGGRDSPPKPKYITVPVTQESDDNGQAI